MLTFYYKSDKNADTGGVKISENCVDVVYRSSLRERDKERGDREERENFNSCARNRE